MHLNELERLVLENYKSKTEQEIDIDKFVVSERDISEVGFMTDFETSEATQVNLSQPNLTYSKLDIFFINNS